MELWDVYDENRKLTGKTHERGVPLGPGEYHIIADVWTVNQRSEILLTRRHPDKPAVRPFVGVYRRICADR